MDYELGVWNPGQISSVDGAVLTKQGNIRIEMPTENADYLRHTVAIHFPKS
jgi:hypothetical protein